MPSSRPADKSVSRRKDGAVPVFGAARIGRPAGTMSTAFRKAQVHGSQGRMQVQFRTMHFEVEEASCRMNRASTTLEQNAGVIISDNVPQKYRYPERTGRQGFRHLSLPEWPGQFAVFDRARSRCGCCTIEGVEPGCFRAAHQPAKQGLAAHLGVYLIR
ncbi:hypothetical protein FKP32DRAFT_863840 [Trametes sanguinea]|nr:hypothetical protein FKP32DRAFT_863840 [Trametes sanguinea]